MFGRFGALVLILVTAAGSASAAELALPVTLVPNATVNDQVIRLGDIFRNAGEKADTALVYAPRYGSRTTFDARWLAKVARLYRLDWRPASRLDRAVVERAAQKIDRQLIESELLDALAERGLSGKLRLALDGRSTSMFVSPEASPTVTVSNLRLSERGRRFSATIAAPADRPVVELTIYGRYFSVIEIPVPARRMGRGKKISSNDIEWTEIDANRIQRDTITDAEQLVGMEVRRFLPAGAPVRLGDVRRPLLVTRGRPVILIVRTRFMKLTARGKAMDNGSSGDIVRVMNSKSRKIIEGVVVDADTVEIKNAGPLASNSAS